MKKSLIPEELKEVRPEAIHVTGFGTKVQSNDLGDYFKDFSPISCEWIDGKSANVIWGVDASAAKAMCYMSRPVTKSEDSDMENVQGSQEELVKKFEDSNFNEPIDLNQFKLPDPPAGGPWRLGKPSGHENFQGTYIYMRLAFKDDIHKPLKERDLNLKNVQLRREGILSRSKKERIQQTLEQHQRDAIEHEQSKKYKHLGSDPWGAIAEDWTGTKKAAPNFDDELAFMKDMMTRKRPLGNRSIDWDAPENAQEEEEDDLVRVPRQRGIKRQRLIARDGSESPPSTTIKLSEIQEEDPWTTKSKRPKMQMYADTVGEKSSAKQRIFGSIKRQVPNRPRTEIFEEETSEPEIDDSYTDAREKLKSIRVKAASFDAPTTSSSQGRSNIFGGAAGKKSNIRDRLGQKSFDGYQSGDSLERDTGADLGPYNNSDKIQIRVTHSDNEEEQQQNKGQNRSRGNREEAMEEDVDASHRDLDLRDRRRKSSPPPRDLRSKISSEVVKIKTEKGEDDRRMRENRYLFEALNILSLNLIFPLKKSNVCLFSVF